MATATPDPPKVLSTTDAREKFSDVVNRVAYGHERILVGRRGHEEIAVIPVGDLRLLEELEDRIDLLAALEALRERGSVSWSEVKRRNRL